MEGVSVSGIVRALQGTTITRDDMSAVTTVSTRDIVTYARFEGRPIEELVSHLKTLKEYFTKDGSTDEEALSAALRRFFSISGDVDFDDLGIPKLKLYVTAVIKAGFTNDKNWKKLRQKNTDIKNYWSDARKGELMLVMKWVLFPDKRDIFKLNLE